MSRRIGRARRRPTLRPRPQTTIEVAAGDRGIRVQVRAAGIGTKLNWVKDLRKCHSFGNIYSLISDVKNSSTSRLSAGGVPDTNSYDLAEISDAPLWDDFARRAVGGTPFATTPWLACAGAATGEPWRLFGCFRNGRLVAGVSGLARQRGFGRQLVTPPLFPHGGFLHLPSDSRSPARLEADRNGAMRALIEFLHGRFDSVQLTHAPGLVDAREFIWAGWKTTPRYTYQLDLVERQDIWDGLERRTRTAIRKAEKEGFRARATNDTELLRRQFELVYDRQHGAPPVEVDVVGRVAEAAQEAGLTETWLVESPGGATGAIVAFTAGGDQAYAWIAGADPSFRDSGAAALLYWRFLEQTGASRFDFAGANIPGIALFKRGFGCQLVPYFAVEGYRSRWLGGLASLRRWLSGSSRATGSLRSSRQ